VVQPSAPPILLLHELDQRARAAAYALPQQIEVKLTWDGVGYRLGDIQLVSDMDQVKEILTHVTLSRLPGVKPWVKGVANVRGNLLPILDLRGLILGETAKMTRRSRVLVLQHRGIHAGLVVDEVLGMRHFLEEEYSTETGHFRDALQPYLSGVYKQGGAAWGVLDIHRLVEAPEFMMVAA
jgi:twitching motility protein PilI